jgi:subtilisin family serine protease
MHTLVGLNALDGSNRPMDDLSHGTHVAGILGAAGGNRLGVVGNWKASQAHARLLRCIGCVLCLSLAGIATV